MSAPVPHLLAENANLAFIGEKPWPPAGVTDAQARSLEEARNPTGRPNSDVLRRFIGFKAGRAREHWAVDFPLHYTEQEAALYLKPCHRLRAKVGEQTGSWWLNPHAQRELRPALARLERYLATPLAAAEPVWDWIDSTLLPDESLLVVARDDDFAHGLLRSRLFQMWWRQYAPVLSPIAVVTAFPFPWPPATLLSSLTRMQEEQRLDLAHAARGADPDRRDSAALAAYGWPAGHSDADLLAHLAGLNRQRPKAGL